MRECGAAIVLKRAKHRIGVVLVRGLIQVSAGVIAAQIVTERDYCGVKVKNVAT